MSYLVGFHIVWLIVALLLGVVVGAATWLHHRSRWMDGVTWLATAIFALGALAAVAKLLPNRSGYWLELALLMIAAYIIGCFVGWALRALTAPQVATAGGPSLREASAPPPARPAPPVAAEPSPHVPAQAASAPAPVPPPAPAPPAEAALPPAPVIADEASHAGRRPLGFGAPRGGKADDLKRIRGIGPQNEGRLHGLGVWHFDQIAAWSAENVEWVGSYLAFPGRIDREGWIEQAKTLAAGAETEFSKRVDQGLVPTSKDDGDKGQDNVQRPSDYKKPS